LTAELDRLVPGAATKLQRGSNASHAFSAPSIVNVKPFHSQQDPAAISRAKLLGPRAQQEPDALRAAVVGLAREAEAYLAAVDVFRAEGFEPTWRSDGVAISPLSLHALDGAGEVSARGCK